MDSTPRKPAPLLLKPDLDAAAERWEAFYHGEIIDRPVVCVTAPRPGCERPPGASYYQQIHDDLDGTIERALMSAAATYYAGEAVPSLMPNFGPDEIAAFTGADLVYSADSPNTTWSKPYVEDWEESLPLSLQHNNPLWQRMLEYYRLAADRFAGRMLLRPLDLHTNMDLLAAVRGPQRLCLDLIERPQTIDRAMQEARRIFREVWFAVSAAGRMDERGYVQGCYSMEGAATLQCDFSCMISPTMFRRWVLPALEEEAALVRHVVYHWDGPGALVHTEDLIHSRGLHTLSFVPGDGHGRHIDYLDLFRRVQEGGKAVEVHGSPDELKIIHRRLRPEKTLYVTEAASPGEAEELLAWFALNT